MKTSKRILHTIIIAICFRDAGNNSGLKSSRANDKKPSMTLETSTPSRANHSRPWTWSSTRLVDRNALCAFHVINHFVMRMKDETKARKSLQLFSSCDDDEKKNKFSHIDGKFRMTISWPNFSLALHHCWLWNGLQARGKSCCLLW